MKGNIAVIIPAHNEEGVISNTIKQFLRIVDIEDIYVVDDGSDDETFLLSERLGVNVVKSIGRGKAQALNFAISYFNILYRYDYILFMDADTYPDESFINNMMPHFLNDNNFDINCVVGRVKGTSVNWISKYRQWEYQISHMIHKRAQSILKSIIVVPGCATIYRSFVFKKLKIPEGTLTEDMDLTFLMHRKGLNNMVFEDKAVVYTQDPQKLRDFIKQLYRWYTGFWQVVRKHNIPWKGQVLDLEVAMLASEGLYNGLLSIIFLLSIPPLLAINRLTIFAVPLLFDLFVFFIPTIVWSAISDKDYLRILYLPQFYFLRFISCMIFFISFFKGYLSVEKLYFWQSKRYALER